MMNSIRNVVGEFPPPAGPSMDIITDAVLGDAITRKSFDVRNKRVKELIARFNGGDRLKSYKAIANEYRGAFLSELAGLGTSPAAVVEISNQVTRFRLLLAGIGFVVSAVCVLWWWSADHDYPAARPQCETRYRSCSPYEPPFDPCNPGAVGYYYSVPTYCGSFKTPGNENQRDFRLAIIPFLVAGLIWFVPLWTVWLVRQAVGVLRYAIRGFWVLAYPIYLVRHGTALQRGLARFWLAVSAGWLVHSSWWIFAHCNGGYGYYTCTSGTFRIERASFKTLDLWGYVLTTPVMLLLATVAAYWVIRGFRPKVG
jgi:hypothetical protein